MNTLQCKREAALTREEALADIQAEADSRGIPLQSVGVSGVKLPLTIVDIDQNCTRTIIEASAGVSVRAAERGAHMSRLVDELQGLNGSLSLNQLGLVHRRLLQRSCADAAELAVSFTWFVSKAAPVSAIRSLLDVQAHYSVAGGSGAPLVLKQRLQVPVTTLCPCSKAISRHGAHNQRTLVTVSLEVSRWLPIGELTRTIEAQSSCEVFGTLKRIDEKYVTEKAYENPRFVEDVARDLARCLESDQRIVSSRIEVESLESIHNHQAFAVFEHPFQDRDGNRRLADAGYFHTAAIQD